MKRYKSKKERSYGTNLFIKGERGASPKAAFRRRPYPPGIHGKSRRRISEYGKQLAEKQKLRISYGIKEKQLKRLFEEAAKFDGPTDLKLLELLERRLDNVVFRMGIADTRAQARQLVVHGLIMVNNRRLNIPSYRVRPGDVITLKERLKKSPLLQNISSKLKNYNPPKWISLDKKTLSAKITSLPDPEDLQAPVELSLVTEYYSR